MTYLVTIPVEFPHPRHTVYEALCDLGGYPKWTSGMKGISHLGPMYPGLIYEASTEIMGKLNVTTVEVVQLVPDKAIVLESRSGMVKFRAVYVLEAHGPQRCKVICSLKMEFDNLIFQLAQSAVGTMTENRIRADLETLCRQLGEPALIPKQQKGPRANKSRETPK